MMAHCSEYRLLPVLHSVFLYQQRTVCSFVKAIVLLKINILSAFTTMSYTCILFCVQWGAILFINIHQNILICILQKKISLNNEIYLLIQHCVIVLKICIYYICYLHRWCLCSSESLVIVIVVIVIVCAVLIILGMVFFLLWKRCSSPEPPLPKALVMDFILFL